MVADVEMVTTPDFNSPLPVIMPVNDHANSTIASTGELSAELFANELNSLNLSDVLTIDKATLDKAILNAEQVTHNELSLNGFAENQHLNEHDLKEKILQQKTTHESFITIDLGLSNQEINSLNSIEIIKTDTYNNFAQIDQLDNDVAKFLQKTTQADEAQIALTTSIIKNLTNKIIASFAEQTAWVAVRTFLPTSRFDIPRWHIDGHFVGFGSEHEVKFVTLLTGDQTLFYPASTEERNTFLQHEEDPNARMVLNELLDPTHAISVKQGQGVIFIVGDPQHAAIHSEPKMTTSRLFLSIVVGSHAQIRDLQQRWGLTNEPVFIPTMA